MNEHEKNVIEKISHYASKEVAVHITCNDDKFYNGIPIDVNDIRLILLDKKLGEVYLPINEIKDVEPYKEADKDG